MGYIYQIRNVVDDKVYIGSTAHLRRRFARHLYELRRNVHGNVHLQRAFVKHGEQSFRFEELYQCPDNKLLEAEEDEISCYIRNDNIDNYRCYNLEKTPTRQSRKQSAATRKKIGDALRGRSITSDQRAKISNTLKGHAISEGTRNKIAASNTGKKLSSETKKRLSSHWFAKRLAKGYLGSGYFYDRKAKRYRVYRDVEGKRKYFGIFTSEIDAALRAMEVRV